MVTILFLFLNVSLITLISTVDMYYYHTSFVESVYYVLSVEPGTRKSIVLFGNFIGFIVAVVIDYRDRKNKKENKKSKENEA